MGRKQVLLSVARCAKEVPLLLDISRKFSDTTVEQKRRKALWETRETVSFDGSIVRLLFLHGSA
jgi:hypothetical protein